MEKLILAGEIHKKVELSVKEIISPGISLLDISEYIENEIIKLTKEYDNKSQLNGGIAFPTGICLDNIAAHWTPSLNSKELLLDDSVCKIDFGTHIDGYIVDSAFTVCFNDKYNPILEASKMAVNEVINKIGVDMRMSEIGDIADEIVSSYEYDGKPLVPIDNLYGHNIMPYKIHGGKYIPSVSSEKSKRGLFSIKDQKVEDGDMLAIEVFVSNGEGTTLMSPDIPSNHFMIHEYLDRVPVFSDKKTRKLFNLVKNNFGTLAFCPRYINNILEDIGDYSERIQDLFRMGIISSHPPLVEKDSKAKVAQFEHTILVTENGINLIS